MTTCLETFEKERFCSFPHIHGEATGKPETRDETRWTIKTGISRETSSNFHTLLCSFKINVSPRVSYEPPNLLPQNRFLVRGFRQFFITSHKRQHLPRNLHLVATWRSPDNATRKNAQRDTSKALRLRRKMTMDTSKVLRLPGKLQRIFWKRR